MYSFSYIFYFSESKVHGYPLTALKVPLARYLATKSYQQRYFNLSCFSAGSTLFILLTWAITFKDLQGCALCFSVFCFRSHYVA